MANQATKLFFTTINNALDSVKGIIEAKDRANVYAQIANALALSGLVSMDGIEDASVDTSKAQEKPKTGKEALKPEAAKGKKEAPAKTKEEPKVQAKKEDKDEWTDENQVKYKEQLEQYETIKDYVSEEDLAACLKDFSNGKIEDLGEIKPSNITDFVEYLKPKANAYAILEQFKEAYEESDLNQCVDMFSEGEKTSLKDITPINIEAFVTYLEQMVANSESEEE